MPYHFEFDAEHKLFLTVVSGDFTDAELLSVNEGIRERVEVLHPVAGIGDFTHLTAFNASTANVAVVARGKSPYAGQMPRFLVAPQDHVFGLARMYQLIADPARPGLQVVRSREEAFSILGVVDPKFVRLD